MTKIGMTTGALARALFAAGLLTAGCVENKKAATAAADEFAGYRERPVAERVELDAFENAAFEDMSKYGADGEHVEIGRFGYNGNGGARIRPRPQQVFCYRLKTKPGLSLKKGVAYVLTSNVRTHGAIGVQTCFDVVDAKTRKYAFGGWGPSSEAMNDGWVRHVLKFVPKADSEGLDYHFQFYCRQANDADFSSGENYVDVDNVAIHTAAPTWYFCNTWPTHNRVHSETGRVRMSSTFLGAFLDAGADPVYRVRLRAADGRVLGERVLAADAKGNMTAAFGRIDYAGAATLCATLFDRANRLNLGTREIAVTVGPAPDASKGIFVQENGVVLRDGRPYMPVGFYTNFAYADKYTRAQAEAAMKRMQDAGFNAMIDYGTYSMASAEQRAWYYGACEKYGIGVLNDDFKACTELEKVPERLAAFRRRAEEDAKRPALLGFYTMDEGSEDFIPSLTLIRRMLNEVAPDKIVNVCNIMRPEPYLPIADIQGGDSYPIGQGKGLTGAEKYVRAMSDLAPAALWVAPQAYNWASMVPGALTNAAKYASCGREPKENETLSVALLMASLNVKGFFFYSYYDVFRCPVKEWIPRRWENVCRAGKCLRDLEPFIMSGEPIVELARRDAKGRTRVVAMSDGKGAHRVLVIGLEQDHETTFELPASFGALKSRCGNVVRQGGTYVFRGPDFSCDVLE